MNTKTKSIYAAFALLAFACLAVLPTAQAVNPPPDGCYPGFTTAEGCNALNLLTTGAGNTGVGWYSLFLDTTGSYNTGLGAGALALNTADSNTAVGAGALLLNTSGTQNVAVGTDALVLNDSASSNTAIGYFALFNNNTGDGNTANGAFALEDNMTGSFNTAMGIGALGSNTTGFSNTATGNNALFANTAGDGNTAVGNDALHNNTGSNNIAMGGGAGNNLTMGDNNIDIGHSGVADEANTIRIGTSGTQMATFVAGISGTAVVGDPVVVDGNGQLGTATSSARFKKHIKPMETASEAILALKPVSFQYKSDSKGKPQFGLIAEEVAKVNPDLVTRDPKGEIYSVRYEAVNAMLLNEFLKEHKGIQELKSTVVKQEASIAEQRKDFEAAIAQQRQEIQTLTAQLKEQASQIQKVSAQLELNKAAPQTVLNNQ